MKLIIDIPEDVFTYIKEEYFGNDVAYCGVKYGIPLDSFPDREKGTDGTLVYNADGHFYGVMGGDAIMERIRGKANET